MINKKKQNSPKQFVTVFPRENIVFERVERSKMCYKHFCYGQINKLSNIEVFITAKVPAVSLIKH